MKIAMVALSLACVSAYAQDATFDPRSLAMGGTGVTSSDMSNAAFHNPAMLASAKEGDSFALELPVVAVRLLDPNSLRNDASVLSTNSTNLTNALNAFSANPIPANATAAGAALTAFNGSLNTINHKTLSGNALVGTVLSIPSRQNAFSLYVDMRAEVGAQFNYAAGDQTTITNLSTNLTNCGNGVAASCTAANASVGAGGKVAGLQSQLLVRGVVAKDIGIAAARHFDNFYDLDIGITPKFTQYTTYDYAAGAQNNAKVSLNQGQKNDSAFSMDVGAAKTFQHGADDLKAGMAIKNIIPSSFTTVLGNRIDVKPQATVGVSYLTKLTSSGIDLDIIPNKAMMTGFNKDSQYVRLGAEFDAWRWAQIRIGYRHDIKGNYPGLPSIGLGLSPFGIHFDLSVAAASKQEMAASLQTGFRF
jgi:hypothetical protein